MSEDKSGSRKLLTRLAVLSALACIAWVSANFALRPVVMNQGGGRAASTNFTITASIGGPVVAESASASFSMNANTVDLVQAGPVKIPAAPTTAAPVDSGYSFTGGGCAASGPRRVTLVEGPDATRRGASPWALAGFAVALSIVAGRMRRRVA